MVLERALFFSVLHLSTKDKKKGSLLFIFQIRHSKKSKALIYDILIAKVIIQ
jgi:hypothetical protein